MGRALLSWTQHVYPLRRIPTPQMRKASHRGARMLFQGHLRNPCRKGNSPGHWGLSPSNPVLCSTGLAHPRGQTRAPTHTSPPHRWWASGVREKILEMRTSSSRLQDGSREGNVLGLTAVQARAGQCSPETWWFYDRALSRKSVCLTFLFAFFFFEFSLFLIPHLVFVGLRIRFIIRLTSWMLL